MTFLEERSAPQQARINTGPAGTLPNASPAFPNPPAPGAPPSADALDSLFFAAFSGMQTTGKRWLIALDVSGSMGSGEVPGYPGLSPRVVSAALTLTTLTLERQVTVAAFTAGPDGLGGRWGYGRSVLTPLEVSPRHRVAEIVDMTSRLPMGGTDCSLPMEWALEQQLPVDVFAVYTDTETWHGRPSPVEALRKYRQEMDIPARLVVVGLQSESFTIADPQDPGMLDIAGFDATVPGRIASFVAG